MIEKTTAATMAIIASPTIIWKVLLRSNSISPVWPHRALVDQVGYLGFQGLGVSLPIVAACFGSRLPVGERRNKRPDIGVRIGLPGRDFHIGQEVSDFVVW